MGTNFSSVIVLTMFSSVVVPLVLSTLHLVVNRNKILEEHTFSTRRKSLTITLCWIASFLNPIILDAYYHELKEDVRKLTKNQKSNINLSQNRIRYDIDLLL